LEEASAISNSRVLLMREQLSRGLLSVVGDSQGTEASGPYQDDPIAAEALATGRLARGTADHGDERYAEVAVPIPTREGEALLLSASLRDQLETVEHVEERACRDSTIRPHNPWPVDSKDLLYTRLLQYGHPGANSTANIHCRGVALQHLHYRRQDHTCSVRSLLVHSLI
jgi:hypothetical protein